MANVELKPDWWKKAAPKSLAGGAVHGALTEVAKHAGTLEKAGPANYFKALEGLTAAIAKDEKKANDAKDKAALALLADLKKAKVAGHEQIMKQGKMGGGGIKGL
jgi:hypothetical protein